MRRRDLITVAISGDHGKPRSALVIQSDLANATDSVLVMLLTSTVRDAPMYRLSLPASPTTGLQQPSQLMVDKIMAARRDKCGAAIGRIDSEALGALRPLLAFILGMAE